MDRVSALCDPATSTLSSCCLRRRESCPHLPHATAVSASELYETPSQRYILGWSPVGSTPLSRTLRCL